MNWFKLIILAIVTIILAVTPAVYSLDIRVIWAVILDLEANSIAAIMSAVIAGLIFITTVWQIRQNSKRNRLLVKPLLGSELDEGTDGKIRHVKFELVNYGLGPAIITRIVLFVDGIEELQDSTKEYYRFMENKIKENKIKKWNIGFLVPNSIMEIGNKQIIWSFEYNLKTHNIDFIKNLNLLVEYKSIYGEKMPPYDTRKDGKFHVGDPHYNDS